MGDGAGTLSGGRNVVMDIGPTTPIRDENGKRRPTLSPATAVFTPEREQAIAPRLLAFVPECPAATDLLPNVNGPPAVSLVETGTSQSTGQDIEMEEKGRDRQEDQLLVSWQQSAEQMMQRVGTDISPASSDDLSIGEMESMSDEVMPVSDTRAQDVISKRHEAMQQRITDHQMTANSFHVLDNDEDDGLWATSDEGEDTKLNSGVFEEGEATDFTPAY